MFARGVLFVAVALLGAGCAGGKAKAPKTYPVKGKVVYADGSAFPGGFIEFRPAGQSTNALGMVEPDGTFKLATLYEGGKIDGAIEGEFTVTVTPHMGAQEQGAKVPVPIKLPGTVRVKPDDSNDLTITLPATVKK